MPSDATGVAPVAHLPIGQYLIQRLRECGVRDVLCIPGDYVLAFYAMLEKSPLNVVGCTREDCAGYAADAYARINGIGAVCVTYCVGGLSVCNSTAGAYAEKSPVVVISGSPVRVRDSAPPFAVPAGRSTATERASPKSVTKTRPSRATSTLSGLKSRWTSPAACAAASPAPAST